jgi:predicted RNA-binding Zn ribbon-like protein
MCREDEDLLLDLLNTTPTEGGQQVDFLADGQSAGAWLSSHGISDAETELDSIRLLRSAIAEATRGTGSRAAVNVFLAGVQAVPEVGEDGLRWERRYPDDGAVAARLALTWAELEASRPGRLRPCANDECTRFLIDRSKANSAQWCSMALCGNRMKARRHYEKARREA